MTTDNVGTDVIGPMSFRLSAQEKEDVIRVAALCNMTVSAYVRGIVVKGSTEAFQNLTDEQVEEFIAGLHEEVDRKASLIKQLRAAAQ